MPVNLSFVEGSPSPAGEILYTREQAKQHFLIAAACSSTPFIICRRVSATPLFSSDCSLLPKPAPDIRVCFGGRATWKDGRRDFRQAGACRSGGLVITRGRQEHRKYNQCWLRQSRGLTRAGLLPLAGTNNVSMHQPESRGGQRLRLERLPVGGVNRVNEAIAAPGGKAAHVCHDFENLGSGSALARLCRWSNRQTTRRRSAWISHSCPRYPHEGLPRERIWSSSRTWAA